MRYHNQVIATLIRIMATAKIVVRVMNDPKNKPLRNFELTNSQLWALRKLR